MTNEQKTADIQAKITQLESINWGNAIDAKVYAKAGLTEEAKKITELVARNERVIAAYKEELGLIENP